MERVKQTGRVEVLQLSLQDGREAEVLAVGPEDGHPALYLHSPATSGEELTDAASDAARRHLRLFSVSVQQR